MRNELTRWVVELKKFVKGFHFPFVRIKKRTKLICGKIKSPKFLQTFIKKVLKEGKVKLKPFSEHSIT